MLPPPYCYKINRCFAFTLAEVLITLVIVGIVSALTVPTLIAKYQEQQTVSKVKKVYSTFAQAYNRAVMDNGPADTWEIGTFDSPTGANNLYNYFKPYLIDTKRCDQSRGCWPDNYKSLTGESYVWQPNGANYYSTGTLADGTIFAFHSDSSGCNANYGTGKFSRTCGLIYFDINGFKKPNQAGKDYFCLLITKSGVYPRGGKDLHDYSGLICDIKTKSNKNGIPCIAWIIEKGNMDYLYQTVSW